MTEKQELLRHFLAALAYRTQKALRDASHLGRSSHYPSRRTRSGPKRRRC